MKRFYSLNQRRLNLIRLLRKKARENNSSIWRRVAEFLQKSKRSHIAINVSRINRYTDDDDVVVVPGKTLSAGLLEHAVTVAAFSFSSPAKEKIKRAGGKCLSLEELIEQNPKGSGVKIIT